MMPRLMQAAFLVLGACGSSGPTQAQAGSAGRPFVATPVASFDSPWAMAFLLGTDQALVTEKPGRIWRVDTSTGRKQQVSGAPQAVVSSQGGLLDIVVSPTFS